MKVTWLVAGLVLAGVCLCGAEPDAEPVLELTPEAEKLLAELLEIASEQDVEDADRTRRTSSPHAKFSVGSISSFNHQDKHDHHEYGHKAVKLWDFKKAILQSLVQAIKAITGGVIALKGQLTKVGGILVEGGGKLLEHKGAALTEFGKHIVHKALTKPIHVPDIHHHEEHHHHEYSPPSHQYGYYPAPAPLEHHHHYHPAPLPAHAPAHHHGYDFAKKEAHHKGVPDGLQAGLIVLKPLKTQDHQQLSHLLHEPAYQEPQPFAHSENSYDGYDKVDRQAPTYDQLISKGVQLNPPTYKKYEKPTVSRSLDLTQSYIQQPHYQTYQQNYQQNYPQPQYYNPQPQTSYTLHYTR